MGWIQLFWLTDLSDDCDYPEDCYDRYLPVAFVRADVAWVVLALLAATAVATVWIAGARRIALWSSFAGFAWIVAVGLVVPRPGWFGRGSIYELPGSPWFDGDYAVAALALTLSAVAFGFAAQTARTSRSTQPVSDRVTDSTSG